MITLSFAVATMLAAQAQETTSTEGQPIDETQDEVVEMQGEDPEAAMNQESATSQTSASAVGSGITSIAKEDLPQEVTKGFKNSQFNKGTIEEVYVLESEAVDQLIQENADDIYVEDENPEKIYQLQVKGDEDKNVLYFDDQGELLGSKNI